jgi:hypothetical protein
MKSREKRKEETFDVGRPNPGVASPRVGSPGAGIRHDKSYWNAKVIEKLEDRVGDLEDLVLELQEKLI